jgi:transglutaminase-like putative cysteine protease
MAPAAAMTPAATPAIAAANYAAEPAVIELRRVEYALHSDGTGIVDQTARVRVQTDSAVRQLGVLSIRFAADSQRVEILYARVRHSDGTVQETPVDSALEEAAPVTREAPLYSDLKEKELPIRSLRAGDVYEWKARLVQFKPEAPGEFWGVHSVGTNIVLDDELELRVPSASRVTVWTNPKSGVKPVESTDGSEHVYRWKHVNLDPTVGTAADAAKKKDDLRIRTAEEELDTTKGELPSVAWSTFADWPAVAAWYRGLVGNRNAPDAAIKTKVAELIAGKTSLDEKAQALYSYVATQIRYIGVDLGVGRYQPHTAAEVLANQYGDCKDKVTLLAAMLREIGLTPDAVLIGAGIRFNEAVPSPASFNHVITRILLDGKEVWLDSTTEVAPWRVLLPAIRDQQALAVPQQGPGLVVRTPVYLPYPAFNSMSVVETLDKDLTSESTITLVSHDDSEVILRSLLRQISPAQYGDFTQRFMAAMGFGGTTSDPVFARADDFSKPFTMTFHYHRLKDASWGDDRVTLPFAMSGLSVVSEDTPPNSSIQLGQPTTSTSTVEITLPPHATAGLPAAVHQHAAFATCDITYRQEKGKVFAERKFVVLQPKVPADDWKAYKKWYDGCDAGSVPCLTVLQPSASITATVPVDGAIAAAPPSGATAHDLLQQAEAALRRYDTAKAKTLLDQAKQLDPKARGLEAGFGMLAYMLGEANESIADLKKELALYPDEFAVNAPLAAEQHEHGDDAGALATMRAWVAAAPGDPQAAVGLVNLLILLHKPGEAADAGAAALGHMNAGVDTTPLRLLIAKEDVAANRNQEAAAIARSVIAQSTTPATLNDAAYYLSEAAGSVSVDGLPGNPEAAADLAAAEQAVRRALMELDADTAAWTLDTEVAKQSGTSTLLIHTWDTLGWVLYQEGESSEARPWVLAAWRNRPGPEYASHLKAIDKALIAQGQTPAPSVDLTAAPQQLRTYPLGPANGLPGNFGIRLLLARGKPTRVQPLAREVVGKETKKGDAVAAALLAAKINLDALLPPESKAQLARTGYVNCTETTCSLVLLPNGR